MNWATPAAPRRETREAQSPFASFFMGGFESSTQRLWDGRQLDMIAATRHDALVRVDYGLLVELGVRTVRDSLRWHLIERIPGRYDWSSFLPMLRGAQEAGLQVVWDLCHYGAPAHIDIWSPDFIRSFARFAQNAGRVVRDESEDAPVYCPMNEISFWSWAGGDKTRIYPYGGGRGHELKRQLVRAALAAIRAVREVDPRARFMQVEPLIHIAAHPDRPEDIQPAEAYRLSQFQAWDMLAGVLHPELGGAPDSLDMIGVNFYFNNQWVHEFETMGFGHRLFRPFPDMLREVHERYGRPLVIAETGAEGACGPGWLRYIMGEVRRAIREGLPILGLCLYPVMDYPGWEDERHCSCGLIGADDQWRTRFLHAEMVRQLHEERGLIMQEGGAELSVERRRTDE